MATTIERLRAELERVNEQRAALERRHDELDLAIAEAEGDGLKAEWMRLRLANDHDGAHAAWIKVMARHYAHAGRHGDETDREALAAEGARLRAATEH